MSSRIIMIRLLTREATDGRQECQVNLYRQPATLFMLDSCFSFFQVFDEWLTKVRCLTLDLCTSVLVWLDWRPIFDCVT